MHAKTLQQQTNKTANYKTNKNNYESKVIKLRFLSQTIELADKYIAKEHLAAIMDTFLQLFEMIRLEIPSRRSVRSNE